MHIAESGQLGELIYEIPSGLKNAMDEILYEPKE